MASLRLPLSPRPRAPVSICIVDLRTSGCERSTASDTLLTGRRGGIPSITIAACRARFRATWLINGYGPVEATVCCSAYAVAPVWGSGAWSVPIGRPLANTQLFVLDDAMEPVPVGVAGPLVHCGRVWHAAM